VDFFANLACILHNGKLSAILSDCSNAVAPCYTHFAVYNVCRSHGSIVFSISYCFVLWQDLDLGLGYSSRQWNSELFLRRSIVSCLPSSCTAWFTVLYSEWSLSVVSVSVLTCFYDSWACYVLAAVYLFIVFNPSAGFVIGCERFLCKCWNRLVLGCETLDWVMRWWHLNLQFFFILVIIARWMLITISCRFNY